MTPHCPLTTLDAPDANNTSTTVFIQKNTVTQSSFLEPQLWSVDNVAVTTSNNSDFTVVIVTVGSASGSLKAEPKECLTGKGQVLSKGLRAKRISRWLTSILLLIKIV